MIALLVTILFGLVFAYFATLNVSAVTVNFGQFILHGIPIYIVVLGSLLLGIILSTLIYAVDSISNHLILRKKENTIKELKKTTAELIKRIHQVEISLDGVKIQNGRKETDEENVV